jgi:two-component system sensor histidine kinase KdpD
VPTRDRDVNELPERVDKKESMKRPGRLKIFLGAYPGAGKTYALLDAAQRHNHNGEQVLMGIVETHGRAETEALTRGLELLPRRQVDCSGVTLYEFDLNAALACRPSLILVDDLAHTNAPGSRHVKRWQDVAELLAAVIDVYAAMNVQELESLNDVVAQITGVVVRETIPDSMFECADEIEFIDLSPDELLQRLNEGKVDLPEQAARTVPGFFRRGNLIALRELALRLTAARVDEQMRRYKREHAIEQVWPANERILVCIGPGPSATRLVRSARQLAVSMHAAWEAIYVETPGDARLPAVERERIAEALRLA